MAITVEIITERKGYYESQVRHFLKLLAIQNPMFNKTIYDAKRIFEFDLSTIPKKSTGAAAMFYKATEINQKQFTVHHLNAILNVDRVVAIVKQTEE